MWAGVSRELEKRPDFANGMGTKQSTKYRLESSGRLLVTTLVIRILRLLIGWLIR